MTQISHANFTCEINLLRAKFAPTTQILPRMRILCFYVEILPELREYRLSPESRSCGAMKGMQNLRCADTCVKCKFHMQNLHACEITALCGHPIAGVNDASIMSVILGAPVLTGLCQYTKYQCPKERERGDLSENMKNGTPRFQTVVDYVLIPA